MLLLTAVQYEDNLTAEEREKNSKHFFDEFT